jgi:spondin N
MKRLFSLIVLGLLSVTELPAAPIAAAEDGLLYEVTITNLTRGQQFTPILVASHKEGVQLFTLGRPASAELATLAEEGNTGPLTSLLRGLPAVRDVTSSSGLLNPGHSVTVTIEGGDGFDHLSVAAMLIPTNDGFFALNGVAGPRGDQVLRLFSPAYDAGSERNDELCASIPGPFFAECGGPGGGAKVGGGEGFVHIHAGIHGVGNLNLAQRDWRNPVAEITIRRIR